LNLRYSRVML